MDDIGRISPRPVFLIQGMGDRMVKLDSGQRLYDAAGEPRQLWEADDVPHLNMYFYFKTIYTERVIQFFDEYLLKSRERRWPFPKVLSSTTCWSKDTYCWTNEGYGPHFSC